MSRIGKKPITLPKGVTVKVLDGAVEVQGPKGKLRQAFPAGINFELADGHLTAKTASEDPQLRKLHGLSRSLIANAVTGVQRISRPGRRVYFGKADVPEVLAGLGTSILTTSRGVMTGRAAVKAGVGGEVLCNIW